VCSAQTNPQSIPIASQRAPQHSSLSCQLAKLRCKYYLMISFESLRWLRACSATHSDKLDAATSITCCTLASAPNPDYTRNSPPPLSHCAASFCTVNSTAHRAANRQLVAPAYLLTWRIHAITVLLHSFNPLAGTASTTEKVRHALNVSDIKQDLFGERVRKYCAPTGSTWCHFCRTIPAVNHSI
jgi:hypothetical protein